MFDLLEHFHISLQQFGRDVVDAGRKCIETIKPAGEAVFAADDLPANRILTSSTDPETIGTMIEAFNFRTMSDDAKNALDRARNEIFEKFPDLKKDHEHD